MENGFRDSDETKSSISEIIDLKIDILDPNYYLEVDDGEYEIECGGKIFKANGQILFTWQPSISLQFNGYIITEDSSTLKKEINFFKDGLPIGKCYCTSIKLLPQSYVSISLKFFGHTILGDEELTVDEVYFSIPNLIELFGSRVNIIGNSKKIRSINSRLKFEFKNLIIEIDRLPDYQERKKMLEAVGGYHLLYAGRITSKKGVISSSELANLKNYLFRFLSFINGFWTGPLFYSGLQKGVKRWTDYTAYQYDSYKTTPSWIVNYYPNINALFTEFSSKLEEGKSQKFLINILHWYIEANKLSGAVEGAIIMLQTALEYVFNFWIVEEGKLLFAGNDVKNLYASNKIRLILAQINFPLEIPSELYNTHQFLKDNNLNNYDGPRLITDVRNKIIHSSSEDNRNNVEYTSGVLLEVHKLSITYLELSILKYLNYQNSYRDRFNGYNSFKPVPWNKNSMI
ncbi:hypothetical protein [Penaeicola halotolerans]|uniref:hypothetical protein n=1 Tax=Penaeicola halotolerans TaxID=2793196 RepID=UPI001CF8F358|nr:hypothetical protein [Penaeicola halotolerans]